MPDRHFPDWFDAYIKYANELVESPLIFTEWTAISAIASAMERKCFIPFGVKTIFPNMYIVLVGPSGVRKGTAMEPGYDILQEIGVNLAADATTKEALLIRLEEAGTASSYLDGVLSTDSAITIHSSEFTVFTRHRDSEFMSYLCKWYDCEKRFRYETKNKGSHDIPNVWVNIIGATTPSLIQASLPQEAVGGGLTSRMILVYADQKGKIIPIPFFGAKESKMRDALAEDLSNIKIVHGAFMMDEDFIDKYIDWVFEVEKNPAFTDPLLAGYEQRRRWHLLKLSMIFSASESGAKLIGVRHFDKALELLSRTEVLMPCVFRGMTQIDDNIVVTEILNQLRAKGRVTFAEIVRKYMGGVTLDRLEMITKAVITSGLAKEMIEAGKRWIEYIPPNQREKKDEQNWNGSVQQNSEGEVRDTPPITDELGEEPSPSGIPSIND